MSPDRIACALHDYVEIACLYRYRVRLDLKDGSVVQGKAVDIVTSPEKQEYVLIDDGERRKIDLTRLAKMTAITPNARFKTVNF